MFKARNLETGDDPMTSIHGIRLVEIIGHPWSGLGLHQEAAQTIAHEAGATRYELYNTALFGFNELDKGVKCKARQGNGHPRFT